MLHTRVYAILIRRLVWLALLAAVPITLILWIL